jgi:hypothetical protein
MDEHALPRSVLLIKREGRRQSHLWRFIKKESSLVRSTSRRRGHVNESHQWSEVHGPQKIRIISGLLVKANVEKETESGRRTIQAKEHVKFCHTL